MEQRVYRIGPCRVDLDLNRIRHNGKCITLPPKASAVLAELIAARGAVVPRETLLETVWPDSIPSDDVLTQAIRELRLAFGDSASDSHTIETIPRVGYRLARTAQPQRPRTRWRVRLAASLVLVVAVAGSFLAITREGNERNADQAGPAPELDVRPFITEPGRDLAPRFSRDGRSLAYVHEYDDVADLLVRPVAGGDSRRLTRTPDAFEYSPAWSPEGDRIAYSVWRHNKDCAIRVLDMESGESRSVADDCITYGATFVDWSPDGKWIAYSAYDTNPRLDAETRLLSIRMVSPHDGQSRQISFPPDLTFSDIRPTFSPDGTSLAFVRARSDGLRELYRVDLETRELQRLNPDDLWVITARWTADPDVFVTAAHKSTLFRTFTLNVATGAVVELNIRGASNLDVDPVNELIAFTRPEIDHNIWRVEPETGTASLVEAAASTEIETTPVAVKGGGLLFVSQRSGMWEIWRVAPGADSAERVTFSEQAGVTHPRLSPDGKTLMFVRQDTDGGTLYWQDLATGEARPVPGLEELRVSRADWTPDGCCLVYIADVLGYWQLWRRPVGGGPPEQFISNNVDAFVTARDGTLVVKLEDEPGLHRFDPQDSSLRPIPGTRALGSPGAFAVGDAGVYFLDAGDEAGVPRLLRVGPDGNRATVVSVPRAAGGGLAVDARDGSVYLARVDKRESDIYLARLASAQSTLAGR